MSTCSTTSGQMLKTSRQNRHKNVMCYASEYKPQEEETKALLFPPLVWYPEPGSNRHGLLHRCLRPTRLPIPPSGLCAAKLVILFFLTKFLPRFFVFSLTPSSFARRDGIYMERGIAPVSFPLLLFVGEAQHYGAFVHVGLYRDGGEVAVVQGAQAAVARHRFVAPFVEHFQEAH